jgi:hypothetical protein
MNTSTLTKTILAAVALAVLTVSANAVTFIVPGTADPWLANASVDNVGTPEPDDTSPGQSPVFAGLVTPGDTISWSATGLVGHPGDLSNPDGGPLTSRLVGAQNGISDLPNTPICALIGVWAFPGGGTSFLMGSSGSAVVPLGANQLFLGTMDGFGWANNIGEFTVEVEVASVPDTSSTLSLLSLGIGSLLFWGRNRRQV